MMTKRKSLRHRAKSTLAGLGLLALAAHPAFAAAPAPVNCVRPLVGTAAHGHTYPGATVPFSFVQLSPDWNVKTSGIEILTLAQAAAR